MSDNAPYLAIPKSPHPLLATSGSLKAQLGLSVVWGCVERVGLQERHFYLRTNFKLNRAAALVEWRQLLSAQVQAAPINLMLENISLSTYWSDQGRKPGQQKNLRSKFQLTSRDHA